MISVLLLVIIVTYHNPICDSHISGTVSSHSHVRGVQDDLVQVGEERLERLEISRRQRTAFLAALAAYVGGAL